MKTNGGTTQQLIVGQTLQRPVDQPLPPAVDGLVTRLKSPTGLLILSMIGLLVLSNWLGGGKKGKTARGRWATGKEKAKAATKAKKQIQKPTRNSCALYVGQPTHIKKQLEAAWQKDGLLKTAPKKDLFGFLNSTPTLYLPDVQRGVSVIGAPGTGKTFSVIDPLIRSALDQGFPMLLYDFKYPAQTKRAVAYAIKRGYTVKVFSPGRPESEVCNPLDLIRDEEDAVSAGQLAQVIGRNFDRSGGKASSDKFFEEAGDSLVEGILLVTKAVGTLTGNPNYCDLMTAQAILSLSNLAQRMDEASKAKLKVWTSRPLSQIISVKDSEKTVAGIVGTAQRMFQRFLKKDFVGAFCGQTTLPLDLEGKQLIVFGLDRNNRDIVGPLLAAILHMVVTRNVSRTVKRKDPLVTVLDELPTLYLPALVNWLNENREDGFVGILGYQNFAQLKQYYGDNLARAIVGGTGHKFIFNPQDPESAKFFSDYLGEEEIRFETKSRSTGKGSTSRSFGEQFQKRPLLEPAQFLKLSTGQAVVINPGYVSGKEAYIPLLQNIKVPAPDIDEMNWSEAKWDSICQRMQRNLSVSDEERRAQFEERRSIVEQLFPLPVEATSSKDMGANLF